MESLESFAFQIIALSGDAKSDTLIALKKVKAGEFDKARYLLDEASKKLGEASNVHLKLLSKSVNDEQAKVPFMLIHAEDHYSTASYSHALITELIEVFEGLSNK